MKKLPEIISTCKECSISITASHVRLFCSSACQQKSAQLTSNYVKNLLDSVFDIDPITYYNNHLHNKKLTKLHISHPEFFSVLMNSTKNFVDMSLSNRMWHLLNGNDIPLCIQCGGNHVKWSNTSKTYNKFCSALCSNNSSEKTERTKKTCLKKYGVTSTTITVTARQKLNEYYSNYVSIIPELKVADKNWKTLNPDKKFLQIPEYNKTVLKTKSINKHGQDVSDKLYSVEWLKQKNYDEKLSLSEIATLLNVSNDIISRTFKKLNIEPKYYYVSTEEKQIAEFLDGMNVKYESTVRNIIHGELDFYLPEYKIAIEYCGLYWHSNLHKPTDYHYSKWKKCHELGIRLITIFQNEWMHNRGIVKKKLQHIFGKTSDKLYARKCQIKQVIDTCELKTFYTSEHIQGYAAAKFNYGLYYNDILVAAMSIKQETDCYNLVRFATSRNVVGGFSKLLQYFIKNIKKNLPIKTFADMRWDTGNVYLKTGFIDNGFVKPDYAYIRNSFLWHKFNFRHKQLSKLSGYDPTLSENENTKKMNIHKIYDCGKIRFVLN